MNLSILITYFPNRFEQLKRGLNSILNQVFDTTQVELLFFNDGGQKEAVSLLKSYSGRILIRHFEIKKNTNTIHHSGARRNYLIRRSTGRYLLFTEPEMVHASNTINQTFNAFKLYGENIWYCGRVYATNEVVNKGGMVRIFHKYSAKISRNTLGADPVLSRMLDLNFFRQNRLFYVINYEKQKQFFFWCTALAKNPLIKVKGLKENLQKWGSEEIDLYNRLQKVGVKKLYDPNFVSYHLPHPITLSDEEKYIWGMYNNNIPFLNDESWGTLHGEKVIETKL